MRIVGGKIYALQIPFVEAFAHAAKNRRFSDSFVVRLTADDGTVGFGEGVARSYVTGETVESSIARIKDRLFPILATTDFSEIEPTRIFEHTTRILPFGEFSDGVVWNAARAAIEVALVDCLLKRRKLSLADVLPPARNRVIYSGVIAAGNVEKAVQFAKRFQLFGISELKIKIGDDAANDVARVAAARETLGAAASLRVDANGAFDVETAIEMSEKLAPHKIEAIEQPIFRGNPEDLARVRRNSAIPVMADESLVTTEDAENLIAHAACDFFNLRVSKLGGIAPLLAVAKRAERAGVRVQLGCQVGETAVLSAVGRHVAAHLAAVEFVEGSFGNLLLTEDVGKNPVNFGHGGRAPMLKGAGLGVEVREAVLEKYARSTTVLGEE
jgi:L-Ala-D/L-Glu epimerase